MNSQDWVHALTFLDKITANDLGENGITPIMLYGSQPVGETVEDNLEEATRIKTRLGINGVIRYPSMQMLTEIEEMPNRPFAGSTWNSSEIEFAMGMVSRFSPSENYEGIRLEEDTRQATRDLLMFGDVLTPRLIVALVHIVRRSEWESWPTEDMANEILSALALDYSDSVELAKRNNSQKATLRVTLRHSMLTSPSSKHYTPVPDRQMRAKASGVLISSLEIDSKAKRTDKYKADLLVNAGAKAYQLLNARKSSNPDFLFSSVFLNSIHSLVYSASISIFEVFPKKGSIVRSRYDASTGVDGALQFLHVMQKLMHCQVRFLRDDPALLDTFASKLKAWDHKVKAGTLGAFTTVQTTPHLPPPPPPPPGGGGTPPGGGAPPSGGTPPGDPVSGWGNTYAGGAGGTRDDEAMPVDWYVPSPPWSPSSDVLQNPYYCLESRSLHGELQKIGASLSCQKRKALLLEKPEGDEPFAVAKLAWEREVDLTMRLQSIVGVVKVILAQPFLDHDRFILCTQYAGAELSWYCELGPGPSTYPSPIEVARGIVGAVLRIHKAGFAHCDINPVNICIPHRSPEGPAAVIIDFDISLPINNSYPTRPFGTKGWMAPEVEKISGKVDLVAADIWAVGKVLLYIYNWFSSRAPSLEDVGNAMTAYEPCDRMSLEDALSRL